MCLKHIASAAIVAGAVLGVSLAVCRAAESEEVKSDTPSKPDALKAWAEARSLQLRSWPESSRLLKVAEGDPAHAVVAAFIDRIQQEREPKRIDCKEVKSLAATRLFPDYRFFVCHWNVSVPRTA